LYGKAASVKIVEFPELPEKGDVSDYLSNHSKEDLLHRVDATPIYTPPTQTKSFEFTDMGNAERLSHYYKDFLGYCEKWDSWMSYNGKVWRKGELLAVRQAQETVRLILQESELNSSEDHLAKLYKHYAQSQKASSVKGMLYLARSKVLQIEPNQLDANPDLFNLSNGTVNLKTGLLVPHNKNDFITKCSPVAYDPSAAAVRWERFLVEVFEGNQELIEYLQRAIGYSITGHANERAFFILHGIGRNGKSTLVETLSHIIGDDYSLGMPSESLYSKKNDGGVPNDIARLRGSRFVYSSEGEDGKHLAVAKIKQLTGNEKITSRHMRGEWFDFMANFKIWFSTNHKPEISESAEAIWDRVKLIPFNKRFSEEEKDPNLRQTLLAESAGILNWILEGARKWYSQGLGDCSIVKVATSDYRKDSDLIGRFLEECCERGQAREVQCKKLYERFDQWTKEQGLSHVMSRVSFSKRLREKGLPEPLRRTGSRFFWQGIDLLPAEDGLQAENW
jgi:putative DNA primase/helicase